jgi:hypothetical protein
VADNNVVYRALLTVLNALLDGASAEGGLVLNPLDHGDPLFARLAVGRPGLCGPGRRRRINRAQVHHLQYGLGQRGIRGEEPFADANYRASWDRITVSEPEWALRPEDVRREAYALRDTVNDPLSSTRPTWAESHSGAR